MRDIQCLPRRDCKEIGCSKDNEKMFEGVCQSLGKDHRTKVKRMLGGKL